MPKRWHATFCPVKEHFVLCHMWVLLLGFPLQFWNVEAYVTIGNDLGQFLYVDQEKLHSKDKWIACILVNIDVNLGLLEGLIIIWRGVTFEQLLDYW